MSTGGQSETPLPLQMAKIWPARAPFTQHSDFSLHILDLLCSVLYVKHCWVWGAGWSSTLLLK